MTSLQEPRTLRGVHDTAGVRTVDVKALRCVTTDEIRVHGYDVAYCPICSCRKTVNGSPDWPNVRDEGCSRVECRCHHNHDRGCYGTGRYEDERLCGFDA